MENAMTAFATYNADDIVVEFCAETEVTDYGVAGSPTFDEVVQGSVAVNVLTILGVDVKITDLPADLQKAIMQLSDGLEWS